MRLCCTVRAMTRLAGRMRALRRVSLYLGVGLVAAAVLTELRKPAGQRTWQGSVAGVVPYNFRLSQPPAEPAPSAVWPGGPHAGGVPAERDRLLIPRRFGVGWSLNVPALMRRVRTPPWWMPGQVTNPRRAARRT